MIDSVFEYSTERLLKMALTMLDLAAEQQLTARRKDKWLSNNSTTDAIRQRVADNEAQNAT